MKRKERYDKRDVKRKKEDEDMNLR